MAFALLHDIIIIATTYDGDDRSKTGNLQQSKLRVTTSRSTYIVDQLYTARHLQIAKLVIHRLAASCFNNVQQVFNEKLKQAWLLKLATWWNW